MPCGIAVGCVAPPYDISSVTVSRRPTLQPNLQPNRRRVGFQPTNNANGVDKIHIVNANLAVCWWAGMPTLYLYSFGAFYIVKGLPRLPLAISQLRGYKP
ncbi:MAG: hypothetical protein IKI11_11860 [Neisseriaceae bacterium]|nr:hypothetical protein [Neisseriaceae bacterium]